MFWKNEHPIFCETYYRPSSIRRLRLQHYDRLDAFNAVEQTWIDQWVKTHAESMELSIKYTTTPLEYEVREERPAYLAARPAYLDPKAFKTREAFEQTKKAVIHWKGGKPT